MRFRLFAISLLAACGSPPPAADSPPPTTPIAFGGATVRCPPGQGWRILDQNAEAVVFERVAAPAGVTLTAMAQLFPFEFASLEECRQSLQREEYIESATHRNPHGTVRIVDTANPPYVQVKYSAEQADSPSPNARWSLLTSEFRWFLRPGDNRGVMLSFGERRPLDTPSIEYGTQASLFFGSLVFPAAAKSTTPR